MNDFKNGKFDLYVSCEMDEVFQETELLPLSCGKNKSSSEEEDNAFHRNVVMKRQFKATKLIGVFSNVTRYQVDKTFYLELCKPRPPKK